MRMEKTFKTYKAKQLPKWDADKQETDADKK